MSLISVDAFNERFGIPNQLRFRRADNHFPIVEISNIQGAATIALQGGHVISYQPHGTKPVLWQSSQSRFEWGRPIRGGIPICWPWFGKHPSDRSKPAHGFARTSLWMVYSTLACDDGSTEIRLILDEDEQTLALWPYPFRLELRIRVGRTLQLELVTHNTGTETLNLSGAFHSYFNVKDVHDVQIEGLENHSYIDQLSPRRRLVQQGPLTIASEVDRIYLNCANDCLIEDPGFGRAIRIRKLGSASYVAWNPWAAKAAELGDFGPEEYRGMLCVETSITRDEAVQVLPNAEHRLFTELSVEELS